MSSQTAKSEEIWSLIKETQQNIKELSASRKEADQRAEERRKEAEKSWEKAKREMQELRASQKDTDRQIKETSREIKEAKALFTTQWGRLMESLVEGDLLKLLQGEGIDVKRLTTRERGQMSYVDEKGQKQEEYCEIDIIAKNGNEVVVVEVKTTLEVRDVKKFLAVLDKFNQMLPEYKGLKLYGAVAYLRAEQSSGKYAEKQGLFVIRATGGSASIVNQKDFKTQILFIKFQSQKAGFEDLNRL